MMKCDEVVARLYAYTDGELEEREASEVREHAASCEACARRVREQEALVAKFRKSLREDCAVAGLTENVLARLPESQRRAPKLRLAWGLAAAACMAAGFFVWSCLQTPAVRKYSGPKQIGGAPAVTKGAVPAPKPYAEAKVKRQSKPPARLRPAAPVRVPKPGKKAPVHNLPIPENHRYVAQAPGEPLGPRIVVTEVPSEPGTRRVKYTVMNGVPVSVSCVSSRLEPMSAAETIQRPPLVTVRVSAPI